MDGSRDRGVTTVVATILMVAIVVILAATISVVILDFESELPEPQQLRGFGDTEVTLGPEHRSWGGWNNGNSNPSRGDIDVVRVPYVAGPSFQGDEIGSILVSWEGSDGEGGQVRFLNPNRFDADTAQTFHDGDVGEFCTGDFGVGETLTIRMAHNRYQAGGTGTDVADIGEQYVESNQNDIARGDDEPFFRVENRYPIDFSGDRPMDPGDSVEILFIGVNDEQPIARTTAVATAASGEPTERDKPECR
ncbi:archaellin/type IV pilin N-terminal domain-containing protein [Halorubrum ezzemoulense]|uniref:Type IV pilin n=1 Tax=Halorubrum ezzemoulense TaxID=337243 RepID=A0A481RJU8_HALEZ|nr:archaellin/type IV pilin N-terminal domain-containing protein [Halorubrum ezzemoulense]QAY21498.1 type IV pilin [Halorubrum ezzemoulense]